MTPATILLFAFGLLAITSGSASILWPAIIRLGYRHRAALRGEGEKVGPGWRDPYLVYRWTHLAGSVGKFGLAMGCLYSIHMFGSAVKRDGVAFGLAAAICLLAVTQLGHLWAASLMRGRFRMFGAAVGAAAIWTVWRLVLR